MNNLEIIFKSIESFISFIDAIKWVVIAGISIYYFRNEIKSILDKDVDVDTKSGKISIKQPSKNKKEQQKIINIDSSKSIQELRKIIVSKDEVRQTDKQKIFKLTLEKHFEYTYRIIFRSQIILLQQLELFEDGWSALQIQQYFNSITANNDFYKSWKLSNYLKFLYDQNLIEKDITTNRIKTSNIGEIFLKYISFNKYNYNIEKSM